jgi:thiamine-phosphate pyrophosphorylase
MIIVITSEKPVDDEEEIINELFREGLDLLHIRKPFMTQDQMSDFINTINSDFYNRLVLHNHYDMAADFSVSRFHFNETARQNKIYSSFKGQMISTSVHDIQTFNELSAEWEYAFISPAFPSISKKGYGQNATILNQIKDRNNLEVKMIALGGINEYTIGEALIYGADGVALLGAVWENDEPLLIFKKCRQKMMLNS